MKFLADENVPQQSVLLLRQEGFDVKSVGVEFPGVTDEAVLHLAIQEKMNHFNI